MHHSIEKQFTISGRHRAAVTTFCLHPPPTPTPRPPQHRVSDKRCTGGRERLLGTQVEGQNDPVCLIREKKGRKKNIMFPSDPCCGELSWKHSGIVNADGLSWGVLVCQPVSLCLLIIRDTQITDSLHHKAMTHAHLFFPFQSGKRKIVRRAHVRAQDMQFRRTSIFKSAGL